MLSANFDGHGEMPQRGDLESWPEPASGSTGAPSEEVVCLEVLERVMSDRSTRLAWLLGFLTGSALVDDGLPLPKRS